MSVDIGKIIKEDDILNSYITVSRKRYSRIYKERDKYKCYCYGIIGISIILILLLLYLFLVSQISLLQQTEKVTKLNNELNISQLNAADIEKQLTNEVEQLTNEVEQLKDRILFLSFYQAMLTEVVETEEEIIETAPIINWSKYTSLWTIGQEVPLPENIDTNTFRCMDYRKITDTTSWQYEIQSLSKTNPLSGLRYYEYNGESYYTVALATAYGIDLGNAYKVTLQNGTTFKIVHAEYKHDIRYPSPTDYGDADRNYDEEDTISVIEFIYDWMKAPKGLIADGEANRWLGEGCDIYGDGCNIMKMEYLGKIWSINS